MVSLRTLLYIALLTSVILATGCPKKGKGGPSSNPTSSSNSWSDWKNLGQSISVRTKRGSIYQFRNDRSRTVTITFVLVTAGAGGTPHRSGEVGPLRLGPGVEREEHDTDGVITGVELITVQE